MCDMSNGNEYFHGTEVEELEVDEEEYIRNCFAGGKFKYQNSKLGKEIDDNRKRTPALITKQVIPPDDVRRTIAKCFETAWNSYDRQQLYDFFHGFGTENMLLNIVYPNGNPHGPAYREIHSPLAATEYYFNYCLSSPDCLFLIHNSRYVVKPNGHVCVVCEVSVTGSRLFLVDVQQSSTKYDIHQTESDLNSHMAEVSPSVTDRKGLNDEKNDRDNKVDLDEYLDPYNANNESLVFKDTLANKNKHDKYRRRNHSTMGEYIDALRRPVEAPVVSSGSSNEVDRAEPAESTGSGKRPMWTSSVSRKKFPPSDVVVCDGEAKFGLGALLNSSVKMVIEGVLTFHVNEHKKVYKIEMNCSLEENSVRV